MTGAQVLVAKGRREMLIELLSVKSGLLPTKVVNSLEDLPETRV